MELIYQLKEAIEANWHKVSIKKLPHVVRFKSNGVPFFDRARF